LAAQLTRYQDPVDEFELLQWGSHPFINQVAVIDKAIRDIKAVRDRYQRPARMNAVNGHSDNGSEENEEDPFDNFRSKQLDSLLPPTYTLPSGTYKQVPSRYATVGNLISIYSSANKSDIPGKQHPGTSADTRFGTTGKPPFDTVPRRMQNRDGQRHAAQQNNQNASAVQNVHRAQQNSQTRPNAHNSQTQSTQNERQAQPDRNRGRGRRANRSTGQAQVPTDVQLNLIPSMEQNFPQRTNGSDQASQYSSTGLDRQSSLEDVHHFAQMHAAQLLGQHFQHNHPVDHLIGQQPYAQIYTPQQTPGANISTGNNRQTEAQNYYQQYDTPQNGQQQNGDQQQELFQELNNMRQDTTDMFTKGGSFEYARFLDNQNNESRARGEPILRGDVINGEPRLQFLPSAMAPLGSLGNPFVMMPTGGGLGAVSSTAGMLRNPFAANQPEQADTSSSSSSYGSGSRTPTSGHTEQLLAAFGRSRSDTAFFRAGESHQQDQAQSRHRSALHSPTTIFNSAGRSLQSMIDDSHRVGQRIGHSFTFGGRPGSATNSTTSSEEHRAYSIASSDNTIFGEMPGSISRKTSPSMGFRRVNAAGGRRLWESRVSSPGLRDTEEAGTSNTDYGRGRPGHSRHDSRRSVSAGSMR
jgi:hypothetical protein